MKGPTGRIRITTTIAKAGNGTKDIGTTRTTTTAIGATMIVGGGMVNTTIMGMSTTTNRSFGHPKGLRTWLWVEMEKPSARLPKALLLGTLTCEWRRSGRSPAHLPPRASRLWREVPQKAAGVFHRRSRFRLARLSRHPLRGVSLRPRRRAALPACPCLRQRSARH